MANEVPSHEESESSDEAEQSSATEEERELLKTTVTISQRNRTRTIRDRSGNMVNTYHDLLHDLL